MNILRQCIWKLQDRKAQILLPSVLLAPIFILVVYLLFETAKVSMTKVRQQFALDNAAYSQMSAASTYLNAVAMVNGPLPYRVMLTESSRGLVPKGGSTPDPNTTVFDLFYKAGAFPSVGKSPNGINNPPAAESTDWNVHYYKPEGGSNATFVSREPWETESPTPPTDAVSVIDKNLVENYHFSGENIGIGSIVNYLETYARVGSIYKSQSYVYKELSKNAIMFREAYFLNVNDCKRSECARQSAAKIRQFTTLGTTPFELEDLQFFVSDSPSNYSYHGGAYPVTFNAPKDLLNGDKLFQFAFLTSSSRSKLRTLSRGLLLEQSFKLPRNHFNINLEQKYKPYVRNRVFLTCPRSNNNCVWPNPLPKYSITLDP